MTTTAALPVRADKGLMLDASIEGADLLGGVVDFYHRKLFDNQAALECLAGRGIGKPGDPTTGLIDVDALESMGTTKEVQA